MPDTFDEILRKFVSKFSLFVYLYFYNCFILLFGYEKVDEHRVDHSLPYA